MRNSIIIGSITVPIRFITLLSLLLLLHTYGGRLIGFFLIFSTGIQFPISITLRPTLIIMLFIIYII